MKYLSAWRSYVHACHLNKSERDARHFWTWRDWLAEYDGLLGGLETVREACLTRENSDAVASQRWRRGPFSKSSLCIDSSNELFSLILTASLSATFADSFPPYTRKAWGSEAWRFVQGHKAKRDLAGTQTQSLQTGSLCSAVSWPILKTIKLATKVLLSDHFLWEQKNCRLLRHPWRTRTPAMSSLTLEKSFLFWVSFLSL